MPTPRVARRALLAGATAIALSAATLSATATTTEQTIERTADHLTGARSKQYVHVKFTEGSAVRLRGGRLTSLNRTPLPGTAEALAGAHIEPMFDAGEAALDMMRAKASGLPDLNQWYRVKVGANADAVAAKLAALDSVATAYAEPLPVAPPAPDYRGRQGYTDPASVSGIDADYAHTIPGGTGSNVRVVDIEYGWHTNHEDLSKLRQSGALIANGTPRYSYHDHGTAVMGQLGSDANTSGTTGIVPGARLHYTNAVSTSGYTVANAIITAARAIGPGDVILLEQQASACGGYAPIEVVPSVYDAIRTAVASGIHVVEAAGNGSRNLDDACFAPYMPPRKAHSGAIIVGAGGPNCAGYTPRARLSFSTYGSRVDLQGWGQCVTTTGYGDLYGSTTADRYTARFSGTSSASPIVAGAVAALSSIAEQRGIALTPRQLRDLLVSTGAAQQGGGHIGPLPNLRAAISRLGT